MYEKNVKKMLRNVYLIKTLLYNLNYNLIFMGYK